MTTAEDKAYNGHSDVILKLTKKVYTNTLSYPEQEPLYNFISAVIH